MTNEMDWPVDPIAAMAEITEAEFMFQYMSMTPPSAKSALKIETTRMGGGVVLSMAYDVTDYWSKALGFGFAEPVTRSLIDRVVDFYREQGSRGAVIQIAPSALPPDWPEICAHHNIRAESQWVKLVCAVDDVEPSERGLRVEPVGFDTAARWASVTLRGFGMPEQGLTDMLVASLDNPAFRPFAAWDGDEMVATANLFILGQVASMNSATTLPGHRNRGAHSALLAARAREAKKAGCNLLVAETGKPSQRSTNPSLTNLVRSGFHRLYDRDNWVWQPA